MSELQKTPPSYAPPKPGTKPLRSGQPCPSGCGVILRRRMGCREFNTGFGIALVRGSFIDHDAPFCDWWAPSDEG